VGFLLGFIVFFSYFGIRLFLGISEKKNIETHVALHENFSGLVSATNLVKVSQDTASLVACTRKQIFCLGVAVFL